MKKLICEIQEPKFEDFLIELNGYGFEILDRENTKIKFAIYADETDFENTKEMVECVFKDLNDGNILQIETIKEEDWENIWKENFKPIKIPPFIIIPEWEIYTGRKYIPIKIHIGKAFGTGLHQSTQIILKLLPKYIKKGNTVIDIGTGSGILAIASKKLGAESVIAIDIDKHAIEECELNSWENEVDINCIQTSIEQIKNIYDVAIANLQIEIFEKYISHISSIFDSYLLASGIFHQEKNRFLELLDKNNLKVIDILSMEEQNKPEVKWYGFVIQHK
ncbi:MAG: methyltransferase [Aquificae bacterium]|nr:methyltransferase [Aquificota bacterium]